MITKHVHPLYAYLLGRGPDMTLVHPPHILANLYFSEPLGCPEYEIGL